MTLGDAERALQGACCPICYGGTFSVVLQCSGDRTCDYVLRCERCHYALETSLVSRIPDQLQEEARRLEGQGCPTCGSQEARALLLCDRVTKECFFLVRCPKCHRSSPE